MSTPTLRPPAEATEGGVGRGTSPRASHTEMVAGRFAESMWGDPKTVLVREIASRRRGGGSGDCSKEALQVGSLVKRYGVVKRVTRPLQLVQRTPESSSRSVDRVEEGLGINSTRTGRLYQRAAG